MKTFYLVLIALLIAAELVPVVWFREEDRRSLSLQAPNNVRRNSLEGERVDDQLDFDAGTSYYSDRGGDVELSILKWDTGNSRGLMDAFGHSPDVCLPVSGAELVETFPVRRLRVGMKEFAVQSWMFSHPAFKKKIHAFKFAHSSHPELPKMALNRELISARLLLFRERSSMPSIEIAIGLVKGLSLIHI